MIVLDQVIYTDYGQFDIVWSDASLGFDGDFDRFFAGQLNGLVGAADGDGLFLHFARRSGGSALTIVVCDKEPPLMRESWEDIVEVSVTIPEGSTPQWCTWAGEHTKNLAIPSGTHRIRVSARGRDAGADDEFAESVVDRYLIQLWLSPWRPDAIVLSTSANAEYWHHEIGYRRTEG